MGGGIMFTGTHCVIDGCRLPDGLLVSVYTSFKVLEMDMPETLMEPSVTNMLSPSP